MQTGIIKIKKTSQCWRTKKHQSDAFNHYVFFTFHYMKYLCTL